MLVSRCGYSSMSATLKMRPLPFSAFQLRPDSLPYMMMHLMKGYAVQNNLIPDVEAAA